MLKIKSCTLRILLGTAVLASVASPLFSAPRPEDMFLDKKNAALAEAIVARDLDSVHRRIAAGANVNAVDRDGVPILAWAYFVGDRPAFKALLDAHADPNFVAPGLPAPGHSFLALAISAPDTYWLEELIAHGADPSQELATESKWSLLDIAIFSNRPEAVKVLANAGANLNHRSTTGQTPVLFAAQCREYGTVNFLLSKGADGGVRDHSGRGLAEFVEAVKRHGVINPDSRERTELDNLERWLRLHSPKAKPPA